MPGRSWPDELELDHPPARRAPAALSLWSMTIARPDDSSAAQRGGERVGVLRRHLEMHHAGELPGEARHAAARPVGAEALRAVARAG